MAVTPIDADPARQSPQMVSDVVVQAEVSWLPAGHAEQVRHEDLEGSGW